MIRCSIAANYPAVLPFPCRILSFPCRLLSFPCKSFVFSLPYFCLFPSTFVFSLPCFCFFPVDFCLFPSIFLSFPCDFYPFPVTVESSVTTTRSRSINSQAYEKSTAGKRLTAISERVPVTNLASGKRIVKYVRHHHVRHFLFLTYNLKGQTCQRSTSVNHYRT